MAAGNFTGVTPQWVEPFEPQSHTIVSQMESMKKQYVNLSGSSILYQYKLRWINMPDGDFWTLYNHFIAAKAGFQEFSWRSVPSYIDTNQSGSGDGTNLTGRWVEGSFKFRFNSKSINAEIVFERTVV